MEPENFPGRFCLDKLDEKQFVTSLEGQKDLVKTCLSNIWSELPGSKERKLALDKCAEMITAAIHTSLGLSTPRLKNLGQGEPWWNDSCREAVRNLRQIWQFQTFDASLSINNPSAPLVLSEARAKLRKIVKTAKREYYRKVIEELDHKTIFHAVKWPSSVKQYTSPPIQRADGLEKQKTLRQELLTPPPYTNSEYIEYPNLYTESRENPVQWHPCSIQEVELGIFHAGNTSPGADEIPPMVVKKAWPIFKEEITQLFQLCLEEGYHAPVFKTAILCALPKPGKRNRSLPQSYRLIALLSCLGKGLERVVAKRLSNIALKNGPISSLHFGAFPGRSAIDATATLTHDVEKAFENHDVLTALAFDIKGAFDRVSEKRLVQRLWEQKIPLPLLRWVSSFLTERKAAV